MSKMLTAERVGFLILISTIIIFAILAFSKSCSHADVSSVVPQQSLIDSINAMAQSDTIKAEKATASAPKKKAAKKKKDKGESYQRSHLDENL